MTVGCLSRPDSQKEISTLQALSYEEFINFSKNFLGRSNSKRLAITFDGIVEKSWKEL